MIRPGCAATPEVGVSLKPSKAALMAIAATMFIALGARAEPPAWAKSTALKDGQYAWVICSHDGLDPEDARETAEGKCLASAAKLGGVRVSIEQKTVQSLTGADSSEVATVIPMISYVGCQFTDRVMEKVGQGYRIWLRCRVPLKEVDELRRQVVSHEGTTKPTTPAKPAQEFAKERYKRGTLSVTTVPKGDVLALIGIGGERVVEMTSNPQEIVIREDDRSVEVRRHGFRPVREDLGEWVNGATVVKSLKLEQEMSVQERSK